MRRAILLVPVVLLSFGCSSSNNPTGPRASALRIVSGNTQQGTVGTALTAPIVVQAVDAQSQGIAGLPVTFTVLSGGGSLGAAATTTDGQGQASTTWTLGTTADTQRVSAKLTDGSTTIVDTIVAVATAGAPKTLTKSAGDNQGNYPGYALADSLAVTVVDQYKNPVSGATVTWTVTGGGGSVSPASSTTNAAGVAKTKWTVGSAAGANTATAAASGLTAVTFQATAGGNPNVRVTLLLRNDTVNALASTVQETAVVTDKNGAPIPGAVVTWSTLNPSLLTVTSTGNLASQVAIQNVGTGRVVGTYSGSADTGVFVIRQVPSYVLMDDSFPNLVLGQSANVHAFVRDANNVTIQGAAFTWSVKTPSIATVTPSGAATAVALGSTPITATLTSVPTAKVPATPLTVIGTLSVTRQSAFTTTYASVSVAGNHACALATDGESYCWGLDGGAGDVYNEIGCPGDVCSGPVPTTGGLLFTSVSAGGSTSCGISSGTTYCWGAMSSSGLTNPPAPVGAPAFASVSVGYGFACGLTASGAAYCWGDNTYGELGNGTFTPAHTPVAVGGGYTFTQISAGGYFACGLVASGNAFCWGINVLGVGNQTLQTCPESNTCSTTPLQVTGGHTFTSISAGAGNHACALDTAGAAWCWGYEDFGQLGDGSIHVGIFQSAPVAVLGGIHFSALSAGAGLTCGLDQSGAAWCWGDYAEAYIATPTAIPGGHIFTRLSAGGAACGLTASSAIYCWGSNELTGAHLNGNTFSFNPVLVTHP